jgi:ATP adenylyltransferase
MNSTPFALLRDFIRSKMRMSHIYQPVMLKVLLESGGQASLRTIASAFLAKDESQLEYYEEITKAMPGKVLAKHGLVERTKIGFRLTLDPAEMTGSERAELVRLCDDAVERYLERRGRAAYDHRRAALGFISGSVRYDVLKRAGGRCELCGISIDERAIEVDHIIPRRFGGTDARENLQALCYRCNANKGARDATDFRAVRQAQDRRDAGCIFCASRSDILRANELGYAVRDRYPVTAMHTLLIPKRHASTYFDLYEPERRALNILLDEIRADVLADDKTVEGFNIGMNSGEVAGQTVAHAHVHVIPRRRGDVAQPRGGVRGVIPGNAHYG